jgi:8-oxo-dGTP diphosphatase
VSFTRIKKSGVEVLRREYPEAPVVGVGAVVIEGSKVLLVRRGHEPLKGCWSIPGGALELGETLEQGVVREVLEECGLSIRPVAIVEVFDKITRDAPDGRVQYHYVLVDYLCTDARGVLCCTSDAAEARWIERDEVHSPALYQLEPFTIAVIEKAFGMAAESTAFSP